MKKYLLFSIFIVIAGVAFAGVKTIGTPRVKNYPNTTYQAGTQSWSIDVGANGMVYFANNECVLEFDGVHWRSYPLPGQTVVRSVYASEDGRIYAGGYNEFGYFRKDAFGKMQFFPLHQSLPEKYRDFDDVWKIYPVNNAIIFQSYSQLMIYENDSFKVIEAPGVFHFSFFVNGKLYLNDIEAGLLVFDGEKMNPLPGTERLQGHLILSLMALGNNSLLLTTDDNGLFKYENNELSNWETPASGLLNESQVFCGLRISDSEFAFGTILNGLIICNKEGELIQHINIDKGLQNNTILSMSLDQYGNLWLGLDNGIDYVSINSPLTYFSDFNNLSSGYAAVIHNDLIYFGTNQGVFYASWRELQRGGGAYKFSLIPGTQGQVWSLKVIDGTLFCGHNSGSFIIEGTNATLISSVQGGWNFVKAPGHSDILIGGTYNNLVKYQKIAGRWNFVSSVHGFSESSRFICFDNPHSLWISHGYKGVYRLTLNDTYDSVLHTDYYSRYDKLPENVNLTLNSYNGKPVFSSGNNLYNYNYDADTFLIDSDLKEKLSFTGMSSFVEDYDMNIWYFTPEDMGVFRKKEDGTFTDVNIPFKELDNSFIKWFQFIYPHDDDNIFIGNQNGFVHYSSTYNRDYRIPFRSFIRTVRVLSGIDSVYYSDYADDDDLLRLPFRFNHLQFEYSANDFENPQKVTYLSKLEGFDNDWVDMGNVSVREFTNLKRGEYVFQIKAFNAWDAESSTDTFSFKILPPWYFSLLAFIVYGMIVVFACYLFVRYTLHTIKSSQQKYREQQEKEFAERNRQMKIESLEAEKEVIRLRNDKLRTEKKQKDMELANTTMQIIQASKALSTIKTDLQMLQKELGNHSAVARVQRILKKVNRNIDSDKQWEVFEKHFTGVHEEFLQRLKDDYPDLSPRELKLCAYLRLNISSKEIADLMNISVRGVEISRYRLRKKLQLEHDQNLTDFIVKY